MFPVFSPPCHAGLGGALGLQRRRIAKPTSIASCSNTGLITQETAKPCCHYLQSMAMEWKVGFWVVSDNIYGQSDYRKSRLSSTVGTHGLVYIVV